MTKRLEFVYRKEVRVVISTLFIYLLLRKIPFSINVYWKWQSN